MSPFRPLARLFTVSLALGLAETAQAQTEEDLALLKAQEARIEVLRKKARDTDDLAERDRLGRQVSALIEDTVAKLSPGARPLADVSLNLVRPLRNDCDAYRQVLSAFYASPQLDARNIDTPGKIAPLLEQLERMAALNRGLIERLNGFEDDAERVLQKSGWDGQTQAVFMTRFRRGAGRTLERMLTMCSLETTKLDTWKTILQLLESEWGNWHAESDGTLSWDRPALEKKMAKCAAELNQLTQRQIALQNSALENP